MSDLISRQAAIEAVTKYCTKHDLRDLLADIEVLPSVEQAQTTLDDVSTAYENGYLQGKFEAQQWIPCSERLPEMDGKYLITEVDGCVTCDYFRLENGDWRITFPIAWMPLPSPYKGEEK